MSNTTSQVFSITFDQDQGLMKLMQSALGAENLSNFSPHITPERFRLTGTGIRTVNLEPVAFLDGEPGEEAVKRLLKKGESFENTGELLAFLANKPEEVAKYSAVVALGELSRWLTRKQFGQVLVPYVQVEGAYRCCRLYPFNTRFNSMKDRILVSRGEVK